MLTLIALVNWFILFIVIALFTNNETLAILLSVIIMGGLVGLSLTPAAEKVFRYTHNMHPMSPNDEAYFRKILSKVMNRCRVDKEIDVFMINTATPNMMVIGNSTLAITSGLWNANLPEEEIEAVLAHEIGHLVNGDSRVLIAASTMNLIGQIASWILTVLVIIAGVFSGIAASFQDRSGLGVFAGMISALLLVWMLRAISWLLMHFLSLTFHAISRSQEYKADEFAKENGYATGLSSFLERIKGFTTDETNFITRLFSTHPHPTERIQQLMAEPIQEQE